MTHPQIRPDITITPFSGESQVPTYLVQLPEGRNLRVSELIYQVLTLLDGTRDVSEVAEILSSQTGKRISSADVEYIIREKLSPQRLLMHPAPSEMPKTAPGLLSLRLRIPLFSSQRLLPVFRLGDVLFTPYILLLTLMVVGFVHLAAYWQIITKQIRPDLASLVPTEYLLLWAMLVLSGLAHELGHLSACHRYGCRSGVVGVGIYIFSPVFYVDVSDSWRLPRRQRLVVDLGGIYFQLITTLALFVGFWATREHIWLWGIMAVDLAALSNLNPVFKLDGYWALSDLSGIPNLHSRVSECLICLGNKVLPWLRRNLRHVQGINLLAMSECFGEVKKLRYVVAVYTLSGLLYLAYFIGVTSWLAPGIIASYPDLVIWTIQQGFLVARAGDIPTLGYLGLQALFPTVFILGLAALIWYLVVACWRMLSHIIFTR